MPNPDDFCPIADQGELPRSTGLRGRFSRRAQLPPVAGGFVRVFIDEHGNPISESDGRSAGERYWANGQTWVSVDVGAHTLEFTFPLRDPTGRIGFVATLMVNTSVTDSVEVARRRFEGVRRFLEPKLAHAVRAAGDRIESPGGGDPISLLTVTRGKMERALSGLVSAPIRDLPEWLSADIASVSIAFDEETTKHHDELLVRSRSLDILDADALSQQHTAMHDIRRRQLWREYLARFLSDPEMRAFEAVFADPSAQNIAEAVERVEGIEREDRMMLVSKLQDIVADEDLANHDEAQKIALESIVSGLSKQRFSTRSALESGSVEQIPEATVADEGEPAAAGETNPDRDWSSSGS